MQLRLSLAAEPAETRDPSLDEPRLVWRWPWSRTDANVADDAP